MLKVEIITNPNEILHYEREWDALYMSCACEASTSFDWTYALLKTHLKKNDTFFLIVLKDSDSIIGILPLITTERKKLGQKLTTLIPISEYYNTHSDFLISHFDNAVIETLATSLFQIPNKWDIFRVGSFLESNPIINHLASWLEKSKLQYEIRHQEPSFFIQFDKTYDEYLNKRSSKFRNYLRRMEKKLKDQGSISYKTESDYNDISVAYNHLLDIEKNSWKHSHGTAISVIAKQENFYKYLVDGAFPKGNLHLLFLFLENKPIAYNLGLIKNQTYLYLKTSYVESFRKFGPSTVLRAKLIQMLIDSGARYFDFPGEPYEWEKQWAEELRWHKSLVIYNNTVKAKLLFTYQRMRKKSSDSDFPEEVQYHDPLDFKPEQ